MNTRHARNNPRQNLNQSNNKPFVSAGFQNNFTGTQNTNNVSTQLL